MKGAKKLDFSFLMTNETWCIRGTIRPAKRTWSCHSTLIFKLADFTWVSLKIMVPCSEREIYSSKTHPESSCFLEYGLCSKNSSRIRLTDVNVGIKRGSIASPSILHNRWLVELYCHVAIFHFECSSTSNPIAALVYAKLSLNTSSLLFRLDLCWLEIAI